MSPQDFEGYNNFKKWAHTHYEVVSILESLQQDLDNIPRVLGDVLEKDYVSAIYDLSIEITDQFIRFHKNTKDWGDGWIETIKEFINEKLK